MVKVLLKSIKKVKRESILSMVCVAFECIFEIIIPYAMASMIDSGIENGNFEVIEKYGIFIICLIIGQVVFGCLCARFAIEASTVFACDLRERMFSKIQGFAFANIDRFSTGSLVTRVTTDVSYVQRAFQMMIRGTIRSMSMLIFSLVLSYTINVKIAVVFTIMLPVLTDAFVLISTFAMPLFTKMFGAWDELNNVISENIHSVRVVKSFNREEYEYSKFKKAVDAIFKFSVKAEKIIALWDPIMNVSMYLVIICIAWFGSKAIILSGNNPDVGLTTGKLMSLITYGMQMLMSLMIINMIYVMIVISSASLKRINEVLIEESKIENCDNPVMEVKDGSINFEKVMFGYKNESQHAVLKNINLKIKSGETIGIIGGTGSGKSSLVNLIPRLYDVSSGSVKVAGIDVRNYDIETLRTSIGIVLQKNVLFSGTIESNLKFGNKNATETEMINACEIAGAMEFINEKPDGFNSVVEQGGTNFSGGQKQRLSIARTILKHPKIMIFDDSTSAVDTKTDAKIREGLKNKLPNTTKIIISQRVISLINCDRIIVMDNGEIIDFDSHENLLKNCELYKEINDLQTNK